MTRWVDPHRKQIDVMVTSDRIDREVCLEMLIPYTRVINVGMLAEGTYKVRAAGANQVTDSFPIAKATSSAQDRRRVRTDRLRHHSQS